ncbi:MAG: TonB-dependent receptor [Xanthomonadales bacterium]|nr:TonB-dependent receptor [Xanthomonadales bacterium]
MKKPLTIATLALSLAIHSALISAAEAPATVATSTAPAQLNLQLFDDQLPASGLSIRIDDNEAGESNEDGAALLDVTPGSHLLTVLRDGEEVLRVQLELVAEENAQLIATMYPDDPLSAPSVFIESSHADRTAASTDTAAADGPPGRIAGRVLSAEDGKPVAGARVYVSGTPLDIVTDAEGRYDATLPPGDYSISVIAAQFSSQTIDGIAVAAESDVRRDIELTPAGLELPEFVVLEPFVEGSLAAFVEEKRTSSAVTDILGAEQISRNGDSDAAGALKRVTGLTLVDGKFIYVRGLGERYSSTLLNGAQIPSPDPTRRVVPLDLFPTEVLNGIVVQKTYSADMPGEFGGGTIQLRTRGVPEGFLLKVSGSVGHGDGTTGEDGLRYDGGDSDWTGFGSSREAPDGLLDPELTNDPVELERIGESLAAQGYEVHQDRLGPSGSLAVSLGDDFQFSDGDWSLGYIAALRWSQGWDNREEQRTSYGRYQDELINIAGYEREQTTRNIDTAAFLSAGLEVGEHHRINATALQVRQSSDETRIDTGDTGSGNQERITSLEWLENELTTYQLGGTHSLVFVHDLRVDWQYTTSHAIRDVPNRRQNRRIFSASGNAYRLAEDEQRYELLNDKVDEISLGLTIPFQLNDAGDTLSVSAGASQLRRDRDSAIRRFRFRGNRGDTLRPIEDIFSPVQIGQDPRTGLVLQSVSRATDFYDASQALDAWYASADLSYGKWRATAGVRQESNVQEAINQNPFVPDAPAQVGRIESRDNLPTAALTWAYSDTAQLRLGFSETVSRPDFRELSPSPFTDPVLDESVVGNPDLEPTSIRNIDLRWEYYFSPTESVSIAAFQKQFASPIELVSVASSGNLLTLKNAREATNRGIEFDVYRNLGLLKSAKWMPSWARGGFWESVYVGANYAKIESGIDLGDIDTILTHRVRALQGQSPYVGNVSLAYLEADGRIEATLLYNVFGARIVKVGTDGMPDFYEQPFNQLDFTFAWKLPWDGWKFKAKLKNLLDPEALTTQDEQVTRRYRKGRDVSLSLEWKF